MPAITPTVLVVEDEQLLLEAIATKLKVTKVDVLSCSSGQQALNYLRDLPRLPDVIWMDFYLPDMNGLELMRNLQANAAWSKIPVLVVSNSASPQKVHDMMNLGAKKYLLKAEYRLDELINIILTFINPQDHDHTVGNPTTPTNASAPSAS